MWAVVCVLSLLSSTFSVMPELWAMLATLVGVVSAAGFLVMFFAARAT